MEIFLCIVSNKIGKWHRIANRRFKLLKIFMKGTYKKEYLKCVLLVTPF